MNLTHYTPTPIISRIILLTLLVAPITIVAPALSPVGGQIRAFTPPIPALHWEKRLDWMSVKTDGRPGAVGDGVADDTDAIQKALDRASAATHEDGPPTKEGHTVYFPPGVYRITHTLTLTGPIVGLLLVGSGRDTRLVWDGPAGGHMLFLNGISYSSFVGLTMDGRGKAAVGFYYNSNRRFQTEVTHRNLAFRNFMDAGILNDPARVQALAETTFENCLFENCGRGVAFPQFNDYDYTFDGCDFRRCGTGIQCVHGNFYVRNCHFQESRSEDILDASEHGSSVRRTTSTGSNVFIRRGTSVAPMTIQDCRVDSWKNAGGAILLSRPPVLLFDCIFTNPPGGSPPVHASSDGQRILVSGNSAPGARGLFAADTHPQVYTIPAGNHHGVVRSADQVFLQATARIPHHVFDAKRDFGARGDGAADDTLAVQKTIDAAATARYDAIAYLPAGSYNITQTLHITGQDFFVGGSGWATHLVWKGPEGGVMVQVQNPHRVVLENMAVGNNNGAAKNSMDIHQTGSTTGSSMTYDGVYAYGMYQKQPFRKGFWFTGLGAGDTVVMPHVQGNLHFVDCGRASILANCSYEGSVIVEGKGRERDGLIGFQTRLATEVTYGLYLRNSQNIVMSDFYVEQADSGYRFEGGPGDPPGRTTIQGAKVEFTEPKENSGKSVALDIHDYHGQIFFGPNQFYIEPKIKRIRQEGAQPVELFLLGCSWYDNKPDVQISPAAKLLSIGNEAYGMKTVQYGAADVMTPQTLPALVPALDDLRRLGELDGRLNHG